MWPRTVQYKSFGEILQGNLINGYLALMLSLAFHRLEKRFSAKLI
jgi:hypothetical protein